MMNGMAYSWLCTGEASSTHNFKSSSSQAGYGQLNATCTTASIGSEYTLSSSGHE